MKKTLTVMLIIVSTYCSYASASEQRVIKVSAQGSVEAEADKASFEYGIVTLNKNSQDALNENAVIANLVKSQLVELDIEEKHIQTKSFNLSQRYEYDQQTNKQKIVGFEVRNVIKVTNIEISELGKTVDQVILKGGTNIQSINFYSQNIAEHNAKARALAVKNALTKAEEIANAADVGLGDIVEIREVSRNAVQHPNISYGKMAMSDSIQTETSFEKGSLNFRVNVDLVIEID